LTKVKEYINLNQQTFNIKNIMIFSIFPLSAVRKIKKGKIKRKGRSVDEFRRHTTERPGTLRPIGLTK